MLFNMRLLRNSLCGLFVCGLATLPTLTFAASFSDLSSNDPVAEAASYLSDKGILTGYSDGSFRSDQPVNRAEAIKFIVLSTSPDAAELRRMTKSAFTDVPDDSWFLPYVEWARTRLGIIDGPPKASTFRPGSTVRKSEFLKMSLLAQQFDPQAYNDVLLPLSSDTTDTKVWFYPYLRLSVATSMTTPTSSGLYRMDRELTRGDVALLLTRLLRYKEGARTQFLLSSVEDNLLETIHSLNSNDIRDAEYASARALLSAKGAGTAAPKESIVAGALKITEAYRSLVRGYRALVNDQNDSALKLSKEAWSIAQDAMNSSPDTSSLASSVKKSAETLGASARKK